MTCNILIISFLVPEQCVKKVIETPVHIFFCLFFHVVVFLSFFFLVVFLYSSFTLELEEA